MRALPSSALGALVTADALAIRSACPAASLCGAAGSCCDTKPDAVGSKRTRYELDCTNAGTS